MPVVIRSVVGAGGRFGAIHSQMPASWFMGVPGIKIVAPAFPADAKALLRAAIDDDNPVLFFEHKRLYGVEGEVDGAPVPLGKANVVREGRDVTLVSAMRGVHECLAAAETLAGVGHRRRGVDLRTLRPLDADTVLASLAKTNRARRRRGGPADRRLGRRGARARRPSAASATSTTPGGSRRPTRPSPTARRSRTRTCRGAERIAAEIARRLG